MPFGDGTGPNGKGPMTGRRLGYGAGYNMPGYLNPKNKLALRLARRRRKRRVSQA